MANDFNMTNNTSNNRWDLTYTVDASGTKTKTLETAGTFVDRNIQVAITTPAGSATVAGGALTRTANYSGTPTVSLSLDSQSTSGIEITDTAQTSGYYVKLTGSSSALSGTTTAKRAAITLARTAGYITAQSATTVTGLGETTVSPTVTVNSGSKTRYLKLPTATFEKSGASVYASAGGWVPEGSTSNVLATIDSGAVTPAINNTNLTTYFNTGTSSNYSISLQPTYTNTAGYIAAHTGTAGNGTTSYYAIKTTSRTAGTGSVTLTAGSGNVTLSVGAGDSGSSSATSMSMATTTPTSGVYYTLTATGKGTVTGTGKGTVSTGTGWITSGSTTSSASASASKDSNTATTYGYIAKSVHGDVVTGSTPDSLTRTSGTYLDIEIQPNGYLKIPAGYYPLDRYIFSNKADISGEATAASDYSLNISSISGSSDVSVGTLASGKYPIIANNISVTGTLTAGTAGWFSSGEATDSDTDNVTVGTMPAAKITASSSNATATTTVAPGDVTIAANTTGVSGKTRVAITPTTATTGISTYYIAVKANAAANSTGTTSSISGTATASVSTAGYAPTTLTGSGNVSGTATAKTSSKDSSVYYLPLPTAAGAWGTGTTVVAKATPGITNTNSIATITNISGKTAGTDYWTLTPTISSSTAGSYAAKYTYNSNGQGWVPNSQALTDSARSVTVSAQSGTAIYIPKATYGGNNGNITVLTAGYLPQGESIASMDTVTPSFDGGALNSKGASATFSNITTSTTDNGILIQTKGTAGRDAVLYNGAVAGYVSVADNTTASAAVASSTWDGTKYYVTGITVPKDKTFTLATTADTALDTTSNITITNNAYRQVNITNSGSTTVTSGSKTAGNLTVAAYDTSSSSNTTSKTIVTNGVWTTTAANASGTYYGRVTIATAAATVSGSTAATAPTIARTSTTTSGATNIGSGSASTTAPTSGYFVTLQATAPATTVSLTNTVNTPGYLSSGTQITASANTTAKTGSVYYLPITTGVAAANTASVSKVSTDGSNAGINITASVGNATTTEPTSGYYAAFTGTGSSKVTTAGWFPTGNLAAATSATTYFPITSAVGSVAMTAGDGVCSYSSGTHVTVSDTDTSGVAVTFKGKGSVSATAKITTAGYTSTNNSFATGASTSSSEVSLTKYITSVELVAGKSFSITVPNGSATDKITFVFTVDSNNNVTVAEN